MMKMPDPQMMSGGEPNVGVFIDDHKRRAGNYKLQILILSVNTNCHCFILIRISMSRSRP